MKKIIYSILSSLLLVSCSLDDHSYVEVEKKNFMRNASEAETVLLGVYENMTESALYGYQLSLLFTLGTDQAKVQGTNLDSFREVPSNSYPTTASQVMSTWEALYNAVSCANDFIERLSVAVDNFPDDEKNLAAVLMAEARTLRALYYFELVRWFGNIVLMKSTQESRLHPSLYTQASPQEVYEFIEDDLTYAIRILPYESDDTYRKNKQYRISKAAAIGLLTKVYATWAGYPVCDESKWQKAAATARQLVESGKHGLLDDFEQLWKNTSNGIWDSTESLMEVSFYARVTSSGDAVGRIGKWNGVKGVQIDTDYIRMDSYWSVVPVFLSKWKTSQPSDIRWALSFADYTYNSKKQQVKIWDGHTFEDAMKAEPDSEGRLKLVGLYPAKWDLIKYADTYLSDANYTNTNWYLLRYSDVLLLYAEALNELNNAPTPDAYVAINKVRRRAGLPELSGLSYEEFRQAVRDERSYELCFEGHRKQDLIRWGIYYETIKQTRLEMTGWHEEALDYYLVGEYTVKGKHELLPIPQRELDLMENCVQNPNW